MSKGKLLTILAVVAAAVVAVWITQSNDTGPNESAATDSNETLVVTSPARPTVSPAAIAGRVSRQSDSTPIAGAVVQLYLASRGGVPAGLGGQTIRTSDDGSWSVSGLDPGAYNVSATAPGFLPKLLRNVVLRAGASESDVVLSLAEGGQLLSGTVTDIGGGPVGAAMIRVAPVPGILRTQHARGFSTFTDDNGHYSLRVLNGRYLVSASHGEYVPSSKTVELRAGERVIDFALAPGGVIEGVVLSESTGQPVANARISYARERIRTLGPGRKMVGQGARGSTLSGPDGKFRVRGLGAGAISLRATAPGTASLEPTVVHLGIADSIGGVQVYVRDAFSITGRVMTEGDKANPATGVWVTARTSDGRMLSAVAPSAEDGSYYIDSALPGRYRLTADSDKYITPTLGTSIVVAEADRTGANIVVVEGAMIVGRIEPVSVAEVKIQLATAEGGHFGGARLMELAQLGAVSVTDEDGVFEIGPVRPGELTLSAKSAQGKKGTVLVDVPATGLRDVVIRIEDKSTVSGRVQNGKGKPVSDAIVTLKRKVKDRNVTLIVNGQDLTAEQSPTHEDGSFVIHGVEPGDYRLSVIGPQGQRLSWHKPADKDKPSAPMELTIAEGVDKTGLALRVETRDGVIRGVVKAPDGSPAPDTWVTATPSVSGNDLMARLGRPGGPGEPEPQANGHDPPPGAQREMRMMMVIEDGESDDGATGIGGSLPPVLTDESGRFEIRGLRHGKYALMAEGLRGKARGFLKEANTGDRVTITLAHLTRIDGTVLLDGKPVRTFRVELSGESMRSKRVTDDAGKFSFHRVDPGQYQVKIKSDAGDGEATVTVEAGSAAKVIVDVKALVKVSGRVVDQDGQPVVNARVVLASGSGGAVMIDIDDSDIPSMTNASGAFSISAGEGKHILIVMGANSPAPRLIHPFEAKAGPPIDLGTLSTSD